MAWVLIAADPIVVGGEELTDGYTP